MIREIIEVLVLSELILYIDVDLFVLVRFVEISSVSRIASVSMLGNYYWNIRI